MRFKKSTIQKETELSIRLFDKKEAYLAEILAILSMVRNVALDIIEFGHTDETVLALRQSNDVVSSYLNAYEKRNILYVPKSLRHEAAHILHAWRSFCADVQRVRNTEGCMERYSEHIRKIERLVEDIKLDIGRV